MARPKQPETTAANFGFEAELPPAASRLREIMVAEEDMHRRFRPSFPQLLPRDTRGQFKPPTRTEAWEIE